VACLGLRRGCDSLGMGASLPQRPLAQENGEYFLLLDAATKPCRGARSQNVAAPSLVVYIFKTVCSAAVS
jgi:hypothetical protein